MRSCLVEVGDIRIEHALELLLVEYQHVVKACLSHAPQKAFADRIGSGSVIGRSEHLDVACCCHPGKTRSKLAVGIMDQILQGLPIQRGFPKLLGHPAISR